VTELVLVLNAGSSSIKFAAFRWQGGADPFPLFEGQVEGLGASPRLEARGPDGATLEDRRLDPKSGRDHRGAIDLIEQWMEPRLGREPVRAVGHRVVHGGTRFAGPVRVDAEVLSALEALVPLAPLHQPHCLAAIHAMSAAHPDLPQVACFDTAFHRAQPPVAQAFALPRELSAAGVRRYGFHGLSFESALAVLAREDPALARGRLVVAHLGNGASLAAVRDGRSAATTMGLTALDGLVMGTRCGALDPGVVLWLMDARGLDARAIEDLLYRRSGLLGVSGIASDMRTLLASEDPHAREAIDLFVYRIGRELGSMAAALGGLDALVFTGGIGEHAAPIRARVCRDAGWLGVVLDGDANARGGPRLDGPGSRVAVRVVAADENLVIARHVGALLGFA
jgi:acetate kinase